MKSLVLLDPLAKTFTRKEKILYFLVAGFFISLFLPDMPVVNNIFVGAILLAGFFFNSLAEKRQLLRQRKGVLFMLLFYALHIVSALFSADRQEGLNMLVLRVPLLIFPLSIGLLSIRPALKDRILLCFCVLVTLMALACLGWAYGQYLKFHDNGLLYDDSLTDLISRQSIYIALTVNLALFSYFYLLWKPGAMIRYRGLAWAAIAFLLVFHFLLASRIALIVLYSSLLFFAIYYVVKKRRFLEVTMLVAGLLIGALLLVKFFPKTLNRFSELRYTGYTFNSQAKERHYNMQLTADQWNGANIRLAVWNCGWELARQHWLVGVQLGDKQARLMDVYRSRQFDIALRTRRNTHDTYLDVLCCFGIIGLLTFLAGWLIFPLVACYRRKDGLGSIIILAIAVAMITESYFDRSIGCLLAGFFICFVVACEENSLIVLEI